jgi:uncharacterized protein YdeI (YjbR/CyaY-like superfamily)
MIKEGRMTEAGMKAFQEGLKKPTIDHNIPKNAPPPKDLIKALSKNKKALEDFNSLAPSTRFMYIVWIERAKMKETRKRRIGKVVEMIKILKPKKKGKY